MISNHSAKSRLTLLEQWPVKAAVPKSSVMVATGDGSVLVGDQYQDGCFLLNLNDRSCDKEVWPQPERISLQEQTGYLFPEKGIRDLSVSTVDGKTIAAVAAKGQYASCWQVGSSNGWVLDSEAHAVAVAPHANAPRCVGCFGFGLYLAAFACTAHGLSVSAGLYINTNCTTIVKHVEDLVGVIGVSESKTEIVL